VFTEFIIVGFLHSGSERPLLQPADLLSRWSTRKRRAALRPGRPKIHWMISGTCRAACGAAH